jgi:hypothetical protein
LRVNLINWFHGSDAPTYFLYDRLERDHFSVGCLVEGNLIPFKERSRFGWPPFWLFIVPLFWFVPPLVWSFA